jgi:hypothetical protein
MLPACLRVRASEDHGEGALRVRVVVLFFVMLAAVVISGLGVLPGLYL